MILPSLYNPLDVLSRQGSSSLGLSVLLFLSFVSFIILINIFSPIMVISSIGVVATARIVYSMFNGE